jgi:radical SAM superfamily enzyme YgiQ (UPF0313 family)
MALVTIANITFPYIDEAQQVKFLPLEALSLAAALEAKGHHVDCRDYQQASAAYADPQDPVNAAAFFADAGQVVFITTRHDSMPVAILWAERLKALDARRLVVLGGYGPKPVASHIIAQFPFVDAVIYDTLEIAGPQLLDHLNGDWSEVAGIVYQDRDGVFTTPPPTPLQTLDHLPLPAYQMASLDDYYEIMIFSARGCPFRCAFCVRGGKLVEKSIERVVQEISTLRHTYGQKRVFFYDQTFTLRKSRVVELCRRLRAEPGLSDVEWSCTGRLNIGDLDLMAEMADSGCKMIYFGAESGSDRVLKRINKRITRAMSEQVMMEAQRFFFVNAFFIWGFPFESMADLEATMDLILRISEQGVAPILYVFSPLPSSGLEREYADKLAFSRQVWEFNWPAHLSNSRSRDLVAQFIQAHPKVFPGFYSCDPLILDKLRVVRELGLETRFPDV